MAEQNWIKSCKDTLAVRNAPLDFTPKSLQTKRKCLLWTKKKKVTLFKGNVKKKSSYLLLKEREGEGIVRRMQMSNLSCELIEQKYRYCTTGLLSFPFHFFLFLFLSIQMFWLYLKWPNFTWIPLCGFLLFSFPSFSHKVNLSIERKKKRNKNLFSFQRNTNFSSLQSESEKKKKLKKREQNILVA